AKDSVEREGAGGGVGARVVGVEAEVDRLIGGDRCVVPRVGGGNTLAALCQRGAPRVADLLVSGKVPFQGPVVDDVAVVGDLDLCGEAGSPVVGDRVIDGTARGGTGRAHGDKGKCGANSTSGKDGGAFSRTRGSGTRVAMDSAHASTSSGFPAGRGDAVDSRVDTMHTNPFFCSMERCGGARVKASPGMFGSVPSRAVDRWDHGPTSAESATQQRKDCVGRGMRKRAGDVERVEEAEKEGDGLVGDVVDAGTSAPGSSGALPCRIDRVFSNVNTIQEKAEHQHQKFTPKMGLSHDFCDWWCTSHLVGQN